MATTASGAPRHVPFAKKETPFWPFCGHNARHDAFNSAQCSFTSSLLSPDRDLEVIDILSRMLQLQTLTLHFNPLSNAADPGNKEPPLLPNYRRVGELGSDCRCDRQGRNSVPQAHPHQPLPGHHCSRSPPSVPPSEWAGSTTESGCGKGRGCPLANSPPLLRRFLVMPHCCRSGPTLNRGWTSAWGRPLLLTLFSTSLLRLRRLFTTLLVLIPHGGSGTRQRSPPGRVDRLLLPLRGRGRRVRSCCAHCRPPLLILQSFPTYQPRVL